ncbi:YMGG-like glycine zipper-containing protein [Burkholderia perseverans]|uniref:YMGG-like glycine zipper-containing protein n=1 Tax=Burkholderia perseverans TaxID=2615214 RepID=UPI001FEEA2B8|nr:YMGG-like glycine zipper-containing protein [Burkholderia perseverans]
MKFEIRTGGRWALAAAAGAGLLSACAVMPPGPSVMALPGTGKTFDQFQADDGNCRQFATNQVGGVSSNQAATASALGSAAVGTALGAAAGAAFNGGRGAAVGAGAGLLAGSVVGMGNAQGSAYDVQRRYDYAYMQCMYAAGDRVPVPGRVRSRDDGGYGGGYGGGGGGGGGYGGGPAPGGYGGNRGYTPPPPPDMPPPD